MIVLFKLLICSEAEKAEERIAKDKPTSAGNNAELIIVFSSSSVANFGIFDPLFLCLTDYRLTIYILCVLGRGPRKRTVSELETAKDTVTSNPPTKKSKRLSSNQVQLALF